MSLSFIKEISMGKLTLVQEIFIWALPVLFAVTFHEVSHGFIASLLGDKTAAMLGRLTLNPLKHIDLIGTIIVPLACLLLGGFIFGWAKPVPVDWRNLRKPQRDMALVAVAGPIANLLMAIVWAAITKVGEIALHSNISSAVALVYMGQAGMSINLILMVLNLIPIPPLDGSRVISSILPRPLARAYDKIEPFGLFILIILIVTNVLSHVLEVPVMWLQKCLITIFGF
jgi:Zn-dependent protease